MRLRVPASLALIASLALPGFVLAQSRDSYLLPLPSAEMLGATLGRSQPGVSASSPVGFGPQAGDAFAGFGYQAKAPGTGKSDGSLSVCGGFFNPNDVAGLEVVLTSLSTVRGGFGERLAVAVKAHKIVQGWGVGVGLSNVQLRGETDADASVYAAATRTFRVLPGANFNSGSINFGIGTGAFRSAQNQIDDSGTLGIFFSSSIRMNRWSSAIFDFNAGMTNLALSFAPLPNLPLVITPTMSDLTGEFGSKARLGLGAGLSWNY